MNNILLYIGLINYFHTNPTTSPLLLFRFDSFSIFYLIFVLYRRHLISVSDVFLVMVFSFRAVKVLSLQESGVLKKLSAGYGK